MAPVGYHGELAVAVGPRLLSGIIEGPGLASHRQIWPKPSRIPADKLISLARQSRVLAGAGFLTAALGGLRVRE
jgi:hypothetical protein